jgi:hypothetical protein
VGSADELWQRVLASTVRTAAAILGQPPALRARIRAAFDRQLTPHREPGGLAVPVAIVLASARRPA